LFKLEVVHTDSFERLTCSYADSGAASQKKWCLISLLA
jgi:hypothetical protein